MNRPIAIVLGVALLLSADAVFARGGRGGGGHAGGGGFHGGARSMGVVGHGVGAAGFQYGASPALAETGTHCEGQLETLG